MAVEVLQILCTHCAQLSQSYLSSHGAKRFKRTGKEMVRGSHGSLLLLFVATNKWAFSSCSSWWSSSSFELACFTILFTLSRDFLSVVTFLRFSAPSLIFSSLRISRFKPSLISSSLLCRLASERSGSMSYLFPSSPYAACWWDPCKNTTQQKGLHVCTFNPSLVIHMLVYLLALLLFACGVW